MKSEVLDHRSDKTRKMSLQNWDGHFIGSTLNRQPYLKLKYKFYLVLDGIVCQVKNKIKHCFISDLQSLQQSKTSAYNTIKFILYYVELDSI